MWFYLIDYGMDSDNSFIIQFLDEAFGDGVKKLDDLKDIYTKALQKKSDLEGKVNMLSILWVLVHYSP